MTKPKIGLLPLYLELYDQTLPERRKDFESFLDSIIAELEKLDLEVLRGKICRVEEEFKTTVADFEGKRVDAIVTLHLAYSPSLESATVLAETDLPIIVFDTTPDNTFNQEQASNSIMRNHGIHGVQDLCNMLIRKGKAFQIEVGHWQQSDVLVRIKQWAEVARMKRGLNSTRTGLIGEPFNGMGDFQVGDVVLHQDLGITTVPTNIEDLIGSYEKISDSQVSKEIDSLKKDYLIEIENQSVLEKSVKTSLAVRSWLEQENLDAFSLNFLAFEASSGIPCVPFLECSLALSRRTGYAGEGDVLTASLVSCLASQYPDTTFTEMFCPDWENNLIFLSHMGEVNPQLVVDRARIIEKPFPFTDAENPAAFVGQLKAGQAAFVNLAPGPNDSFTLILAPVEMQTSEPGKDLRDIVHGWMKPVLPIDEFLQQYSRYGGTHHAVLAYESSVELLAKFGDLMGWQVVIIGGKK